MKTGFVSRIVLVLLLLQLVVPLKSAAFAEETAAPPQLGPAGSLSGKVTPTHEHGGFILATAGIPDLALRVDVSEDGSFHFESVRPGSYLLEVRVPSLGVAFKRVEILPGEETVVEVELTAGSHYEEIVVTASGDARNPLDLAAPASTLSGQELALRLESSLGETLSQEPGINSTFFGPGASRPVIRGLAGDRVRMLEGGLGTGDASSVSADHAVTADPAQAERIEVLRGPATLLYGSGAIGGVVNVIDERIPAGRATRNVGGTVDLRGGSVSDERSGSVTLNGGGGDWAWHLNATARDAQDYEVPGFVRVDEEESPFGVVPNTSLETEGARLGVSRFFGNQGFFGVAVSGFDTNYGLPGGLGHGEEGEGAEGEEEEEETVRIDMEQRRLDLKGEILRPFSIFQGAKVRVGATDYEHVELEGDEAGTFFFNDAFETRVELVQTPRPVGEGLQSGSIGFQYFERELEAVGEEAFLPPTQTDRWAVFAFQELDIGPVRWQFGGRFESQHVDPTSAVFSSRSQDGMSGSLGLVWSIKGAWSLGASVAHSLKLPAPEELYSDGLHVATQAFEIGNPDLDEESGLGLDLSLRLETERISGELTLFRQDFSDFIFQAFTGDLEEGFPVVVYRQADAEFVGAEFKARIELYEQDGHHLHLRLNGDLVDAELDSGENLPRIPPRRLGAGLHYHSERWNATAELRWVDGQTEVAANESPTDGYTLVNASVGYRFLFKNQILDLLLRGRNLTDEEARSHTSFLKDVAPLPGRDVSLALRFYF